MTHELAWYRYLSTAMETTGAVVSMALRIGTPEGDALALDFAKLGLRAARLLGRYDRELEAGSPT